jgi:hypothetical protein
MMQRKTEGSAEKNGQVIKVLMISTNNNRFEALPLSVIIIFEKKKSN